MEVAKNIKQNGGSNDLLDRMKNDPRFCLTDADVAALCDPMQFVGLAPKQTEDYLKNVVTPILEKNRDLLGAQVEINV